MITIVTMTITSKFEWKLNNIRIEKIILTQILAKKFFGGFNSTSC